MLLYILYILILILIFLFSYWMKELIYNNNYNIIIYWNFILGFILFLITELIIFISVFWSWFHMSLIPNITYGGVWPLYEFPTINWFGLALYNTLILYVSSCFISYWEISIKTKINKHNNLNFLYWVILLGLHFLLVQFIEYSRLPITINDSINSVLFFSITGLHLIHVIIGLIFLIIAFLRQYYSLNYTYYQNINIQTKITCFYWHFVDIMWILVFLIVYII